MYEEGEIPGDTAPEGIPNLSHLPAWGSSFSDGMDMELGSTGKGQAGMDMELRSTGKGQAGMDMELGSTGKGQAGTSLPVCRGSPRCAM